MIVGKNALNQEQDAAALPAARTVSPPATPLPSAPPNGSASAPIGSGSTLARLAIPLFAVLVAIAFIALATEATASCRPAQAWSGALVQRGDPGRSFLQPHRQTRETNYGLPQSPEHHAGHAGLLAARSGPTAAPTPRSRAGWRD